MDNNGHACGGYKPVYFGLALRLDSDTRISNRRERGEKQHDEKHVLHHIVGSRVAVLGDEKNGGVMTQTLGQPMTST